MATQSDTDFAPTLYKLAPAVNTKPPTVQNYVGPFLPNSFEWWSYHDTTKKWVYLNDFLYSASWDDSEDTAAVSADVILNNALTGDDDRISNYLSKGTQVRLDLSLDGQSSDELARFVIWGVHQTNDTSSGPQVELTMYDHIQHLNASYDTFLYSANTSKKKVAWNAAQITKDVCKKFGVTIGQLPKCKYRIEYIYAENTSVYDFLLQVWTLERKHSGRRFLIRMIQGKLFVIVKKPQKLMWEIIGYQGEGVNLGGLMDADYNNYLDPGDAGSGTATAVVVRGIAKKASGEAQRHAAVIKIAKNTKNIKQYGYIQKVITVDGVTNADKLEKTARAALKALQRPAQATTLNALGIPWLRSGDPVFVGDVDAGLNGQLFTSDVNQQLDANGNYTMTVSLNFMDLVPELIPDNTNLKPVVDNSLSGGLDGSGSLGNTAGMPSWLFPIMVKACAEANVPVAWASDNALALLIQHESGFSPTAQNPTSSAFGLFQFLDSTWSGHTYPKTSDPYKQCVDGLEYINGRYGSPSAAWTFWQAQSPHWY